MRFLPRLLVLALVLLLASPAAIAGDDDPTPAELATMILSGNEAEHALVAAWLDKAPRATLKAVFAELRELRARRAKRQQRPPLECPGQEIELEPAARSKGETMVVVNVEVRIIDVPVAAAAGLLGSFRPTADAAFVAMDAEQVTALLRRIEKHEGAKLVSAPRMTVVDKQKANVSVLKQVSFVQDYDVEKHDDGSLITDPIIGTLKEGVVIDLRPTLAQDRKTIEVEFEATFAAIKRPIPEMEIEVLPGAKKKVTIQLPEVEVGRHKATFSTPDGGWVLLGGGVEFDGDKGGRVERVALLHVKAVEQPIVVQEPGAPRKDR